MHPSNYNAIHLMTTPTEMATGEAKPAPAESYPMTGGQGTYSYTKNSTLQRIGASSAKAMVIEAIEEKFDLKQVIANSTTLRLADLGCSVGPNTFISVDTLLEAIEHKWSAQGLDWENIEYQVFFSDHTGNDFNTLFASLPPGRKYFAAGVPGTFHGRLFPESSLHLVHSSFALHWLSKVPEEILDKNSPAWNKGRIHYTNAPSLVAEAYSAQFARDIGAFLEARAKELMPGGMVMMILPGIQSGAPHSRLITGITLDLLGSTLVDMAKEGLVSEAQVDSFNLPVYTVSPKEMTELVEINGCFSVERMELTNPSSIIDSPINGKEFATNLRSAITGIVSKHFGGHIIDQLFGRYFKKIEEFLQHFKLSSAGGTQLFVVLKRK